MTQIAQVSLVVTTVIRDSDTCPVWAKQVSWFQPK
jgi:hypothetical protein